VGTLSQEKVKALKEEYERQIKDINFNLEFPMIPYTKSEKNELKAVRVALQQMVKDLEKLLK
jgi:hypothetical protein